MDQSEFFKFCCTLTYDQLQDTLELLQSERSLTSAFLDVEHVNTYHENILVDAIHKISQQIEIVQYHMAMLELA